MANRFIVAVVGIVLAGAGAAGATDYYSTVSGNWGTPANWTPNGIPNGVADNVFINHAITIDNNYVINNVTVGSNGTIACGGAYTLQLHGDWLNSGVASLTNGYVFLRGAVNTTIGGSVKTTFYRLWVRKNLTATTVTMNQDVSCSYLGQTALSVDTGRFITNGRNLDVGNAASYVGGQPTGILDITVGGTVDIGYLNQNGNWGSPGIGRVYISGSPTVTVKTFHRLWNSGARLDMSGGTLNYTGTITNLGLGSNNPGWGFYATGGTVTFSGSLTGDNGTHLEATGSAVVRFAGAANATVRLAWTGNTATWFFNDLRFEKPSGYGVTFRNDYSSPMLRSVTAEGGVRIAAGNTVTIDGAMHDTAGYRFASLVNDGTLVQSSNDLYVSGDWTGTGTFTPGGKKVTFDGAGDRTVALGGGSFNDLTLNKPGGSLSLASDLAVESDLVVTGGSFHVGEHALTLGSAGGAGNVDVDGGAFTAVGTAFGRSSVAAAFAAYPYSFDVAAPAAIGARYADFSGMDAGGINVAGGVDGTDNFSGCTFDHGPVTSGPMLRVENTQTFTMADASFSGTGGSNIEKTTAVSGRITVLGGAGTRWGEDYDNDPQDLVGWPTVPETFSLAQPGNGAADQPVTGIAFDWGEAIGNPAPEYDLYLSTDPENPPSEPPVKTGLTTSDWVYDLPAPLANKTDYYWNVKARNIHGEAWSDNGNYNFRTIVAAPGGFALLLPGDGATGVPLSGELEWQASTDAERYTVFFGTSETSPDSITDVTGTSYAYSGLEYSTDYYWTVVAKNVAARVPTVSGTWQFRTRGAVPEWPAGWKEVKSVPGAVAVKDGGWLTVAPDKGGSELPVVYAAKGNKSGDFYKYYAVEDSWVPLRSINPDEGGRDKYPKKGCVGTTDGENSIYMTKGNNTLGFWKYDIEKDSWYRLPDVPAGPDGKKVKGGTDLAYVAGNSDTGWVYLLKGYRTEFYRYNTQTKYWDTLDNLPYGKALKYNAGSFLAYDQDGGQYLYAHQAKYTNPEKTRHFMFRYDLAGQAWDDTVNGMPVLGMDGGKMKNKKNKDGGSGAWYDGSLYALKGGNTCQFFRYKPVGDSWTELDTINSYGTTAKKKKVKNGGDLAAYGYGAFFALKGNKTYEFWRYVVPGAQAQAQAQARDGVASGAERTAYGVMRISPSPLVSGWATLSYSLPKAGPVRVTVFDVAGRSVLRRAYGVQRMASSVPLDLRGLSAGVYLVRLDADGYSQSQKLVVQR